ncbi:16S rRNA (adenine(1518)-N(6)/adenine(1519)-N(6))-dimethyltransferase RsmA [Pikeienuella sp. HZG-20]|uniref:16S rRNA (adenine(1518)-N(6)/adenine(1519)-N(6))- dimethyltransferase RsmA n=1 Tax=Paludibacillus litoralis TaxID=3133267 RepID=UPI0030EC40F9
MTDALSADGLPPLREVIARHGLSAKKSLGQNFLMDLNLTGRIARAGAPLAETDVVEIGPGPGGLTRALLMNGARRVIAIERDRRCLAALEEIAARWPGRLTVIEGDAMKIDPRPLLTSPAQVIANLPYNVGTALFTNWMSDDVWPPWWTRLTLMFQKEVAERIAAAPGEKAYGRLAVLAQWRAAARIVFEVSPRAFTPAPKVTSAVVTVTPGAPLSGVAPQVLERVTAAAFGQRRKMLRQSLKPLGEPGRLLAAAGIDGVRRAETLTLEEFCALAEALDADAPGSSAAPEE